MQQGSIVLLNQVGCVLGCIFFVKKNKLMPLAVLVRLALDTDCSHARVSACVCSRLQLAVVATSCSCSLYCVHMAYAT